MQQASGVVSINRFGKRNSVDSEGGDRAFGFQEIDEEDGEEVDLLSGSWSSLPSSAAGSAVTSPVLTHAAGEESIRPPPHMRAPNLGVNAPLIRRMHP